MISIFFCYKRYEKINTIERADIPNFNLIKNPNQSLDTQTSCHSLSKNINTISSHNLNTGHNCTNSVTNLTCNYSKSNQSYHELNKSLLCNNLGAGNYYLIDEAKITNNRISRVEMTYQKYKKNFNINSYRLCNNYMPKSVYPSNRPYLGLTQFKAIMGQSLSKRNINTDSQSYLNFSKNSTESSLLQKSNSEPVLKELFKHSLTKSKSIDNEIKVDLTKSPNECKAKLSDKRLRLIYNNNIKSFNDNNLLDPHLIPKVIQKSLIDLHKRSVWNLTHKVDKSKSNSKNALNFLNSNKLNFLNSNVFTQMKSKNEIKMKVNDDFV
ncbi:unnamed protein product [Brachionus calyciflorus]|uniref:Uncharacterized protein n=1 Tax=Brachionus calyciflorus TaxID=104777 RepID=A0A814ISI4_9BILA|nr:unnamed protein product [Brachionus calyciflorus]